MSTRYVWGKYTSEKRWTEGTQSDTDSVWVPYSSKGSTYSYYMVACKSKPTLNRTDGCFEYSGEYSLTSSMSMVSDSINFGTDEFPYVMFSDQIHFTGESDNDSPITKTHNCLEYIHRRYLHAYWRYFYDNTAPNDRKPYCLNCISKNDANDTYLFYYCARTLRDYPDEFQSYVSNRSPSAYPSYDLDSDGYFYYAEDQDVIDPSSVNLPESIRYNSDITISITPSSDAQTNRYGNITYTYQYKFDNGSWTTIETTSETSVELHIPSGKSSIQARVLAQDDIGFTSSTYVLSSTVSIYASDPPSAPSSISVDRTVEGFTTTVTVGEATDTDGTIANYIFERKTQYGDWTQVQSSADLTFVDNPSGSWGTVQYRVSAVDNSGTKGPYITSDVYTVLTDVIVIMGPSKKDFGVKIGNFNLSFYVIVAGDTSATGITVTIKIDSLQTFTSTVDTEELVTGTVEATNLSEGQHTITVTASKGGYTTANETYTFRIEGLTLPEGGNAVQFQDSTGKPVMPISRAEAILFSDGRTLEEVIKSLMG